jgi:Adenylate and Guanylate cyclase catalytic domain
MASNYSTDVTATSLPRLCCIIIINIMIAGAAIGSVIGQKKPRYLMWGKTPLIANELESQVAHTALLVMILPRQLTRIHTCACVCTVAS